MWNLVEYGKWIMGRWLVIVSVFSSPEGGLEVEEEEEVGVGVETPYSDNNGWDLDTTFIFYSALVLCRFYYSFREAVKNNVFFSFLSSDLHGTQPENIFNLYKCIFLSCLDTSHLASDFFCGFPYSTTEDIVFFTKYF